MHARHIRPSRRPRRWGAVVVAHGEGGEVAEPMEGDSVLGRAVANGRTGSVLGNLRVGHVVRRLSIDKEAVVADNCVRGERRSLI